jgi:hypothetical protein
MLANFRSKRAGQHQDALSAVIQHPRTHVVDVGLQCGAAHGHDIEQGRRHRDVAPEFAPGPVGGDFSAHGAFVEDGDPPAIAKLAGGERLSQRVECCDRDDVWPELKFGQLEFRGRNRLAE